MLSYAGVYLGHDDPYLSAWIARNIPPAWCFEAIPPAWPGFRAPHLGFCPPVSPYPVEIGLFRYPCWGAARYGVAHYLVDNTMLDAIRQQVYTGPNYYQAQPLVIDDGVSRTTTALWMLPARPLAQVGVPGSAGQLSLLTLVDDRYFWWFQQGTLTVSGGTTTWEQLYAAIGTLLGVTITVDTVASAYLKPSGALATRYDPLPLLLDAVAASCGQRLLRALDGTVKTQNPLTAAASVAAQLPLYARQAGGVLALTPG